MPMEKKEVIAKNLEFYRKKASLSQLELAKKLNYSNKNISKWENAETTPSIFVLHEIANLYGIKVDDLLKEVTPQEQEEVKKTNVLDGKKKIMFNLSMLALSNAIMFVLGTIAIYVLGLINLTAFNKWLIYLYLTPLSVLSILIYVRVLYKHVSLLCVSLFGWLICVCVYVSLPHVLNISLIFILGAAYQFMAIFITILANLKLSVKIQTAFGILLKRKKEKNNSTTKSNLESSTNIPENNDNKTL